MKRTEINDTKMLVALYQKSWTGLVAYPYLLYWWARTHPKDLNRIATVNSHLHTKKHIFCKDEVTVNRWIRQQLIRNVTQTLKHKVATTNQTEMF